MIEWVAFNRDLWKVYVNDKVVAALVYEPVTRTEARDSWTILLTDGRIVCLGPWISLRNAKLMVEEELKAAGLWSPKASAIEAGELGEYLACGGGRDE